MNQCTAAVPSQAWEVVSTAEADSAAVRQLLFGD